MSIHDQNRRRRFPVLHFVASVTWKGHYSQEPVEEKLRPLPGLPGATDRAVHSR